MSKLYKVDDVTERTNITRQGKVEKLYRVSATSASGSSFTVEIPEADFNKEKVDQVLTDKAALIDSIRKM